MFIVALLMIPKGRVRAWSTILTVMAVMTGGTQLVDFDVYTHENSFDKCIRNDIKALFAKELGA